MRNNTRVIFDDVPLAQSLFEHIRPETPARLFSDPLTLCGVNERFRGYRYDPGERFNAHYDGRFQRNPSEVSLVPFMIYLNEDFRGGATRFHDLDLDVIPRTGSALFLQHAQRHEGCCGQI